MKTTVELFLSNDTTARVYTVSDRSFLEINGPNTVFGAVVFWPKGTSQAAVEAIADAINSALAPVKTEEPPDV
jgi:hypothetical protein